MIATALGPRLRNGMSQQEMTVIVNPELALPEIGWLARGLRLITIPCEIDCACRGRAL